MTIRSRLWSVSLLIGALFGPVPLPSHAADEDWPQFRGPDGQGHADSHELPIAWSDKENIAWKVPIAGLGWSSPVIRGEQIWLTTALQNGRSLRALCLDKGTGKVVHEAEVFAPKAPKALNPKNSYASPTPILEDQRVYVHFGHYGTACLGSDGHVLWQTTLEYNAAYGPSSSPVLCGDLLIVLCQGTDVRYAAALNKLTGRLRWKTTHQGRHSESTPLLIHAPGGDQVVCNLAERVVAYDPTTGKELWSVDQGNNYAQVPRPVCGHGLVYVCGGYFSPIVHAIRPDGHGDVTKTHVVWNHSQTVPQNPSPILVGDELYMVSDKGVASCLDAESGKVHWRERLGGDFSASPIVAEGHIYFLNEEGVTTVVTAAKEYRKLAANKLEGRTLASPAVSGKAIYLRTDQHLYRLEKRRATSR